MIEKMTEAEKKKTDSAVRAPSAEEIEKASAQKTSELESAIAKAVSTLTNPAPGAADAPAAAAPGGAPPAGALPATTPTPPKPN
jgi:hypothetical protein